MAVDGEKYIIGKTTEEIERLVSNRRVYHFQFWRTIKLSAPIYGADIMGSLFDEKVPWNLSEIQSILR